LKVVISGINLYKRIRNFLEGERNNSDSLFLIAASVGGFMGAYFKLRKKDNKIYLSLLTLFPIFISPIERFKPLTISLSAVLICKFLISNI
jgi:hypothetical protein